MDLPAGAVVRVNMAWVNNFPELCEIIGKNANRDVFLDFPQGRTKPPRPVLTMYDAFLMMKMYANIKYFAISNVENAKKLAKIKESIPSSINLVPKIETRGGVENLGKIIDIGIKFIMLDKEDMYLDLKKDNKRFFKAVDQVRKICKKKNVTLLELEGVVFTEKKI